MVSWMGPARASRCLKSASVDASVICHTTRATMSTRVASQGVISRATPFGQLQRSQHSSSPGGHKLRTSTRKLGTRKQLLALTMWHKKLTNVATNSSDAIAHENMKAATNR